MAKINSKSYVYIDSQQVSSALSRFSFMGVKACQEYFEDQCLELEEYMVHNAPWMDRPNPVSGEPGPESNARDKLKAECEVGGKRFGPKTIAIILSHGVSYGVYLEYNGVFTPSYLSRRRPILVPTAERKFPEVFKGMKGLFNRFSAHL